MSKNIKEIGKELLGKSLNSFHRKIGLTQLEKNNEMQDGILDGILSQVDDAYIEKTEQSNVIHLDGSGDGVVVLDSIEGNTMVNLLGRPTKTNNTNVIINNNKTISWRKTEPTTGAYSVTFGDSLAQVDKIYTLVFNILENTMVVEGKDTIGKFNIVSYNSGNYFIPSNKTGLIKILLKQPSTSTGKAYLEVFKDAIGTLTIENPYILDGDWTNRELPTTLEGIQSSFEDKLNSEGKYEIEILSKNKNLYNVEDVNIDSWMNGAGVKISKVNNNIVLNGTISDYFDFRTVQNSWNTNLTKLINKLPVGTILTMSNNLTSEKNTINYWSVKRDGAIKYFTNTLTIQKGDTEIGGFVRFRNGTVLNNTILKVQIEVNNKATSYTISKQNKIKLLINEPLRAVDNAKDRLCVKDGKLTIERNTFLYVLNGQEIWNINDSLNTSNTTRYYTNTLTIPMTLNSNGISDKIPYITGGGNDDMTCIYVHSTMNRIDIRRLNTDNRWTTLEELKTWLRNNNITLVLKRLDPIYEEVLNEYGEPIILEGYENGTLYIDSTVIPTATVRYTPKMESFNTLKEVENNNNLITLDINENIIPYMMDVDYMIMEKEMALPSQINNRKMEEFDMTSMQKRTQDMLERLIKGKTLTEQECKTRVTTYLNAGKITDEQAEELMLVISEVYA